MLAFRSPTGSATVLRIYFGPRDAQRHRHGFHRSRRRRSLTFCTFTTDGAGSGRPRTFDDSGAMPSCIVNHDDRKYLFIGWNRASRCPTATRLALPSALMAHHVRACLSRTDCRSKPLEPYFCASLFAVIDGGKWKLWYASCTGFVVRTASRSPSTRSNMLNGRWIRRIRPNITCIDYQFDGEANARPCVWKENGCYRMVLLAAA